MPNRTVRPAAEPGAYSNVPSWPSRAAWLAAVDAVAAKRRTDTSKSMRQVALALAAHADNSTGRNVACSVETIARQAGCSVRTVRRRLAELRRDGLVVDVAAGRHLTRDERATVRSTGGHWITRATVRALSLPRDMAAHPARKGVGGSLTSPSLTKPARAAKPGHRRKAQIEVRAPRSLAAQRTAAEITSRLPWLVRTGSQHIGALVAVIEREGLAGASGGDVLRIVDEWHASQGWKALGSHAHRPLAWFATALQRARRAGGETATSRVLRDREIARTRSAQRRLKHALEEASAAPLDSPAVAAARASIRASIAAARRPTLIRRARTSPLVLIERTSRGGSH